MQDRLNLIKQIKTVLQIPHVLHALIQGFKHDWSTVPTPQINKFI